MAITREQELEVATFRESLSTSHEWLFFHVAWANQAQEGVVTYEDMHKVMQRWEEVKQFYLEAE